ncbi:MAG TPA: ferrous iron transporter B [Gemmatimonadales bacterium]|nr:ferrous iron transporter B [Gemmatimonadales bacterium]
MRTAPNLELEVLEPPGCHSPLPREAPDHQPPSSDPSYLRVALVGAPNVGKSALFNRLTGRYVTVSNYPGTSVEVARGVARFDGHSAEVLDTPGMYSLQPCTEEERVALKVVQESECDVLVHVVDVKSLPRMLPLTLQLAETGRRLVVALNMMDEAEQLGIEVDAPALARRLGLEVVPIVAVTGRGFDLLRDAIIRAARQPPRRPALPVLGTDTTPDGHGANESYRAAVERQRAAEELLKGVWRPDGGAFAWRERVGRLLASPLTGVPVLLLVLYVGLYQFVGLLGAGTAVDWIEGAVFERTINPLVERVFEGVPWPWMRSLYAGEYGLITLGLRYAIAIILPIVGAFFLFFSLLEDSGYLPRLALLVDRTFKRLGMSGRAVIPMVLGFACDTMATMVTRTLETRRERLLSTLLLALAIPCSAQLGVILALLAGQPLAFTVWAAAVAMTFVVVGVLGARLVPGARPVFYMDIPPLRLPRPGNVLTKTWTRMHWYFREVLPLFLLASVLLWAGELTGMLARAVAALRPVVALLGLPDETATVFLFGFFRRDYGAAGLYDLNAAGALSATQLAVSAVTLTLFVPCVAQFLMMMKERGLRTAIGIFALITPIAFGAGWLVGQIMEWLQ